MSNILEDPLAKEIVFYTANDSATISFKRCRRFNREGNQSISLGDFKTARESFVLARQAAEDYRLAAVGMRGNATGPVQWLNATLAEIISRRLIYECSTDISLTSTITSPTVIQGER